MHRLLHAVLSGLLVGGATEIFAAEPVPYLVKDLTAGASPEESGSSLLFNLTPVGDSLFFGQYIPYSEFFYSSGSGVLYRSDGSRTNTVPIKGCQASLSSFSNSYLYRFATLGDTLYFPGIDNSGLTKLCKVAEGGDTAVAVTSGTSAQAPQDLTTVGSTLYFSAAGSLGRYLWKTDGTSAGTLQVSGAQMMSSSHFPSGSYPSRLQSVNGKLYFYAYDLQNQQTLFQSDGTNAGTIPVERPNSSFDANLLGLAGELYFQTPGALSKSSNPASAPVIVKAFTVYAARTMGNSIYLIAVDPATQQIGLWKSDGTTAGTIKLKDFRASDYATENSDVRLTEVDGSLFASFGKTAGSAELWASDGSTEGTVALATFPYRGSPAVSGMTGFNGKLYFSVIGAESAQELWSSDGTSVGTGFFTPLAPLTGESDIPLPAVAGSKLFFTAAPPETGRELHAYDPTFSAAPEVAAVAAGITRFSATVRAQVDPNRSVTTAKLEYGTSDAYGSEIDIAVVPANGTLAETYPIPLEGLSPATTYHFRVTAANADGVAVAEDGSFTTPANLPPVVTALSRTIDYETTLTIPTAAIVAAASDPDGDPLSITAIGDPTAGGTVTAGTDGITYEPPAGFEGTDHIAVTFSDDQGASAVLDITIRVGGPFGTPYEGYPVVTIDAEGPVRGLFTVVPERDYECQRSTDLDHWETLSTSKANLSGFLYFEDPDRLPTAFYRLRLLPKP